MTAEKQSHNVRFRFKGDKINVDRITNMLEITPTRCIPNDDPRVLKGVLKPYWSIISPLPDEEELEKHILALTEILLPKKSVINIFVEEGYSPDFYIGVFFKGFGHFHLAPELLNSVAKLSTNLDIHMYDLREFEVNIEDSETTDEDDYPWMNKFAK